MKTFNNLPLFELTYTQDWFEESLKLSLVEDPAIEVDFLKFNKEKKMQFSVDEDKKIVFGAAMIPDLKIFRYDEQFGEYFVYFTAETIEKIATHFMEHKRFNLEHQTDTDKVQILQSFIKGNGVSVEQFSDLPDGTWFVSARINDDALWAEVKEGKFNGFSVESFFDYNFSKNNKQEKINHKMSKLKEIKLQLAKLLMKFGTVNANDAEGNLIVMEYEGEELTDGMEVYHTTEEGELKPVEDGIYTIDEKTYEVKDGVIFAKEVSEEEKPEEPKEEEPIVEQKDEQEEEEKPAEEEEKPAEEEEKPAEEEEKKEDGVDYAAELESLKATLTDITGAIENAVQLLNGLTERIMVLEEDMAKLRGFNPKIFAVEKPQPKAEKKTERNFDVFSYMKK